MSDQTRAEPKRPAVVNPILARGTLLTVDIDRLAGLLSEGLGLETVRSGDRLAIHDRRSGFDGQLYWMLEAKQVDRIANPQSMLNHWGLTVGSAAEVDLAFERISAIQENTS